MKTKLTFWLVLLFSTAINAQEVTDTKSNNSISTATKPTVKNTYDPRYMFMNGFDFGLENIDKLKYVGHFNIYIPISKAKKWGINTGLLKLNNLNNDTIVRYNVDKTLNNPLDNLAVGSTYSLQYNKYTTRTSLSTYSAYFQVLKKILYNNNLALSYHFHTELLISKIRSTTTIDTIATRQITITNQSEIPSNQEITTFINPKTDRNYTTASGYFGVGLTLDYHFDNEFSLFTQGTFGWSLEHPSRNSPANDLGYDGYNKNYFYLVRSYFQYNTSQNNNTQLIVGVDFRGILNQVPLNSIYLGLNLDLDKIAGLITK